MNDYIDRKVKDCEEYAAHRNAHLDRFINSLLKRVFNLLRLI